MIPKKPAPDLIRGGNRFSDQIMREEKPYALMSSTDFCIFAAARITLAFAAKV